MLLQADTLSPIRHWLPVLLGSVGSLTSCAEPAGEPAPRPPASADRPRLPPAEPPLSCPEAMSLLPGGTFWVGAEPSERFAPDESPRFRTRLAPFCLDRSEVTVAAFAECVKDGRCTPAVASHSHCNAAHRDRPHFPINCVTWPQADGFCAALGKRLPTEIEWEYAARGGEQYLKYPWGNEAPDGHACWKHGGGSCATNEFPAGAFGLFDISGNVWEWTDDWYAPYPWPPETGYAKVYRGGGWSRRFEKWMHTRLRNRSNPNQQGSHLGFRCAKIPDLARCPFGKADDTHCLAGVDELSCAAPLVWNGVRCTQLGSPRCAEGRVEKPGRGCVVLELTPARTANIEADARQVQRVAAPEFTRDCQSNYGARVHSYRYFGGTHAARNLVSGRDGCKNRDVGVGWNSSCCP